jgi:hypothetical protein
MSTQEAHQLLDRYSEGRGVYPMIDIAAEMLNLERFLVSKPDFVDGVEYHCFYEPSGPIFQALILADSVMNQPLAASYGISRLVASEYGLEHTEPVVRNDNPHFHELAGLATLNELGVDDGSELMGLYRKWFDDKGFSDLYPSGAAIQAVAAESEKKVSPELAQEVLGETLLQRFSRAVDVGFDWIHVYNPRADRMREATEGLKQIHGLVRLLKGNGVLVMQYSDNPYWRATREVLAEHGIKPAFSGGPLGLPFLGFLNSVDVYMRPAHK